MVSCSQQLLAAEETLDEQLNPLLFEQRAQATYDSYILGPGDSVQIEVLDLPELSGVFTVGPDGIIYLPRLHGLRIDGLTIEELRLSLIEHFKYFVIQPEIYITPTTYRPVRVYVGGEVARPGYYTISGVLVLNSLEGEKALYDNERIAAPTLFDALQSAQGVTPFSQLDKVQVTRRRPSSQGGGKIRANVNFLAMIINGNEDVNIRLYDGDSIFVNKSANVLKDQILAASRSNLSPDFVEVSVSGRVKYPGVRKLPQGASLNQAIASAGGPKLLRGRVEFLRFNNEGSTDRRLFGYAPKSPPGDYRNPVLMPGDLVRVNDSLASASLMVLNEITAPAMGFYSVYSIFDNMK